jgi:hypothetical protein
MARRPRVPLRCSGNVLARAVTCRSKAKRHACRKALSPISIRMAGGIDPEAALLTFKGCERSDARITSHCPLNRTARLAQ